MRRFAKGLISCTASVAILMAVFPNLTPAAAVPWYEAVTAARQGIKSAEVKDALGIGFNHFENSLVNLMQQQTKAVGGDQFIVSTVELLLKGGPGNMGQTQQFLDYWIKTMEIFLKAQYGVAKGQTLWEDLCKTFGTMRGHLQEYAYYYNSMGNPPPPPPPPGLNSNPANGKAMHGLKNHLKADLSKMSTVVFRGLSLKDATTLKVSKLGEVDTPVIPVDAKVATKVKVATLPNPQPKPAVAQVTMIPVGGKSGKIATNPQPIPIPQPAVNQAKTQRAIDPLPLPRPVNTAAKGRR